MRTTVRLDDQLLSAAKQHAARTGRTLTRLLEDALRAFMTLEQGKKPVRPKRLPTYGKGGVRPGVNLDGGAELLDLMDEGHGTR